MDIVPSMQQSQDEYWGSRTVIKRTTKKQEVFWQGGKTVERKQIQHARALLDREVEKGSLKDDKREEVRRERSHREDKFLGETQCLLGMSRYDPATRVPSYHATSCSTPRLPNSKDMSTLQEDGMLCFPACMDKGNMQSLRNIHRRIQVQ